MLSFLQWLEASLLAQTLRSFGVWTYGILNLFHILGISTLFGSILLLDLRLLGLWRHTPIIVFSQPIVPVAATGFGLAVVSGICMISVNATEYYGNPFMFYIKFPALLLAIINVVVTQRLPAWRVVRAGGEPARGYARPLTIAGGISLALWLTVIAAGRMVGYW